MRKRWRKQPVDGIPDRLILFDGVCVLCSRWVRFVIERDVEAQFRFVAIQQEYGRTLARRLDIDVEFPETNALILGGHAYFKSDAAIAVLSCLPRWCWVRGLACAPRWSRDLAYDAVARNRYRLFGRTETCLVPTPEIARRFFHNDIPPG